MQHPLKIFLSIIIIFSFSFVYSQSDSALILSEVMFNPASGNNEFIELYNTSETDTIDLTNFKIKYQTSSADLIVPVNDSTLLAPKSFAVIFQGNYDFQNGIYNSLIPSSALILKIDNNAFGSGGMANGI